MVSLAMCMADMGKMWLPFFPFVVMSYWSPFYFGDWCVQGSILYVYSVILVYFFGTKLFSKAMSTHTLTFPGKPVESEILLCEAPEFCPDASGYHSRTIYHKVGKIQVLNIKSVMTCICVCM